MPVPEGTVLTLMPELDGLAWPLAVLVAWAAGEFAFRVARIPRISIYAVVGFALASSQGGLLPPAGADSILLLADVAFGLILFETGSRINMSWLRANPWIGITSVVESALTFAAVTGLLRWTGVPTPSAMLIGSLTMATSPATVLRVLNERRSSGQVTERALHLSALDCVLAVFVFKVLVGLDASTASDSVWLESYQAGVRLAASAAAGALLGVVVPALLRGLRRTNQDGTLAIAIAVILLVAFCHGFALSAVLATLTFGMVARESGILLSRTERGFGVLGDLLSVLLFVFVASTLSWTHLRAGIGSGLLIIAARLLTKGAAVGAFAHVSGITWRKGLLTSLAMTPMSAFVILMLEQTRALGVDLVDRVAPLAAAALLLELVGPVLVGRAVLLAREIPDPEEA